jgi:hypothetical protein
MHLLYVHPERRELAERVKALMAVTRWRPI